MIPNEERISRALKALGAPSTWEVEERAVELIADLLHLCASYNIDCDELIERASDVAEGEQR